MSYLRFKILCIAFLVYWSICLRFSLVYFKKDLKGVYPFDVIPAAEFGYGKFSHWSEILVFFLSYQLVLWCPFPIFASTCCFPPTVLILSRFGCPVPSVICLFSHLIISMTHFPVPNSLPISWLYNLIGFISVSDSLSLLKTVWCRPCTWGD